MSPRQTQMIQRGSDQQSLGFGVVVVVVVVVRCGLC